MPIYVMEMYEIIMIYSHDVYECMRSQEDGLSMRSQDDGLSVLE